MHKLIVGMFLVFLVAPLVASGQDDDGLIGKAGKMEEKDEIVHFLPGFLNECHGAQSLGEQLKKKLEEDPVLMQRYKLALERMGYPPGTTLFPEGKDVFLKLEELPPGVYSLATRTRVVGKPNVRGVRVFDKLYMKSVTVLRLTQQDLDKIYVVLETGDLAKQLSVDEAAMKPRPVEWQKIPGVDPAKTLEINPGLKGGGQ